MKTFVFLLITIEIVIAVQGSRPDSADETTATSATAASISTNCAINGAVTQTLDAFTQFGLTVWSVLHDLYQSIFP
jgi:hypothetical protein